MLNIDIDNKYVNLLSLFCKNKNYRVYLLIV